MFEMYSLFPCGPPDPPVGFGLLLFCTWQPVKQKIKNALLAE